MVPLWQKKSVWQVTTIIQPALCHLVTSHFQEIACNWTPKDQIRWPIFLMLLCMIVLTEKTSKFPQPIIFWILVFSCHKMTLITKITWMPQLHHSVRELLRPGLHQKLKIWGWVRVLLCHFWKKGLKKYLQAYTWAWKVQNQLKCTQLDADTAESWGGN